MRPPIYTPRGAAREYGELALNIYTGCPHRCFYCYVPLCLHVAKEEFHAHVEPRSGIVEAVKKQIEREKITGKTVHLCFTCDPYPRGIDSSATRKIIEILKDSGNNVQILTKGNGARDFDLLGDGDSYGITIDGSERRDDSVFMERIGALAYASSRQIKTWISFEPVVVARGVLWALDRFGDVVNEVKIGKMNHYPSDINWAAFGRRAEAICREKGISYYIKESLRKEMEQENGREKTSRDRI